MSLSSESGRVVTFYSYKGGTGRSMLLANAAWILASNGRRVLAIDWDLEAPGLHRYFSPFLLDGELTDTDGVVDFVIDFQVAATAAKRPTGEQDEDWFLPYADLTRYASPLQWQFAPGGVLDFIGPGRQGASYSTRVNGVSWADFYARFGGAALIDEARRIMKERYDYILIDSRTGVSDASGICTVQLPDALFVLFTLNNQSIDGASGVARSVKAQRGDSLSIFPVPTRIENAEKDKRDLRRERAMRQFGTLLPGTDQGERLAYWGEVAVLYEPYYAYEELLAAFRDEPGLPNTLLASVENLTRLITGSRLHAVAVNSQQRALVLASYEGTAPVPSERPDASVRGGIYVAYRHDDARHASRLYDALARSVGSDRVFMDLAMEPGVDFVAIIEATIRVAEVVLVVIGPSWSTQGPGEFVDREIAAALEGERRVIPVLVGGAMMPPPTALSAAAAALVRRNSIELSDTRWNYDVARLIAAIEVATARRPASVANPYVGDGLRTSAASAQVIDQVLKTGTINWFAIITALVSIAVAVVIVITQLVHL